MVNAIDISKLHSAVIPLKDPILTLNSSSILIGPSILPLKFIKTPLFIPRGDTSIIEKLVDIMLAIYNQLTINFQNKVIDELFGSR